MKKTMMRILALILVFCMAAPMSAVAAKSCDVFVEVSDGTEEGTLYFSTNDAPGASLFDVMVGIIFAHEDALRKAYGGMGLSTLASQAYSAIRSGGSAWTNFISSNFGGSSILMEDKTLEELGDGTYSVSMRGITFTFTITTVGEDDQPVTPVNPGDTTPITPIPIDEIPVDTTPSDTTPSDTTPSDTTPSDTTPSDTTPSDTTPAVVGTLPAGTFIPADEDFADTADTGVGLYLNIEDGFPYMVGDDAGNFNPDMTVTRAQMAQIFYNLLLNKTVTGGILTFRDVAEDAWYAQAVNTLAALGIVKGVGNQTYEPDREITRAEFVAMAVRFARIVDDAENPFADVPADHWGVREISAAASYGWIAPDVNGEFGPTVIINRAEACALMNRVLGRAVSENEFTSFPDVPAEFWASRDINEASGR